MNQNYNFSRVIDREGTNSMKWDRREEIFSNSSITPLWVADSDWPTAPEILESLQERLEHGVFGYTYPGEEIKEAVCSWFRRRYDWNIKKNWVNLLRGVVPALNIAVSELTSPEAGVIIQPPVYYPFYDVIERNDREIMKNSLILDNGQYRMDFAGLKEQAAAEKAEMLLLCSPHNPVGRVWSDEELKRLLRICRNNDVTIIADEIHADFIFSGSSHTPLASLGRENRDKILTLNAPTKTFNLAGLKIAYAVTAESELREKFDSACQRTIKGANIFGYQALKAAYQEGEAWLEKQLEYLKSNLELTGDMLGDLEGIDLIEPEGTYLVWLDFSASELKKEAIEKLLFDRAEAGLEPGYWFGEEGEGFYRLNLATQRKILKPALKSLRENWQKRHKVLEE